MTRNLHTPHRCQLPGIYGRAGLIEKCDICGSVWRSVAPGNPSYEGWRPAGKLYLWLRGIKLEEK